MRKKRDKREAARICVFTNVCLCVRVSVYAIGANVKDVKEEKKSQSTKHNRERCVVSVQKSKAEKNNLSSSQN